MSADASSDTAVKSLVEAAEIERIVYVDDVFAAGVGDIVALLAGVEPEQRAELLGLPLEEMREEDLWQERVRERWGAASNEERASLADATYGLDSGTGAPQSGFFEVLSALLPGVDHLGLALEDWRQQSAALITEVKETTTLILFDQDFSREDGGPSDGQVLIRELEAELEESGSGSAMPAIFYGLVTNKVKAGEEPRRRNEIIEQSGVDPTRFVLISKQNLEGDHSRLALRLRTMLLAPAFAELMQRVSVAVSKASEEAVAKAEKMTAEDLEHMVVQSSTEEGVWPAETMLRVLEVLQRAKLRESLLEPSVIGLTEKLRLMVEAGQLIGDLLADGDRDAPQAEFAPAAVEVAHDEIYESAEHINGLQLPVALGDLFERSDGSRYVVVAQPCDLMVRDEGKRAPDLSHVVMAKVTTGTDHQKQFSAFELPYFERGSRESAFVRLNRPATVRAVVLDACVFNPDGRARIRLQGGNPSPSLLPHWGVRQGLMAGLLGTLVENVAAVTANASDKTQKAILGSFKGDPFQITELNAEEKVIEWDCRRVGRLCDPWARALLARFSQYYARDAYLHDLAGSPLDPS